MAKVRAIMISHPDFDAKDDGKTTAINFAKEIKRGVESLQDVAGIENPAAVIKYLQSYTYTVKKIDEKLLK